MAISTPYTTSTTNLQQLQAQAARTQEVLFHAQTVFPFTLFPDDITIDRVKVTISKRLFLKDAQNTSIQIEDILNVSANSGPFFGTVRIHTRFFAEKPLTIKYLKRDEAQMAKGILQGYIIARHQSVQTQHIPKSQLVPTLLHLGEEAQ